MTYVTLYELFISFNQTHFVRSYLFRRIAAREYYFEDKIKSLQQPHASTNNG